MVLQVAARNDDLSKGLRLDVHDHKGTVLEGDNVVESSRRVKPHVLLLRLLLGGRGGGGGFRGGILLGLFLLVGGRDVVPGDEGGRARRGEPGKPRKDLVPDGTRGGSNNLAGGLALLRELVLGRDRAGVLGGGGHTLLEGLGSLGRERNTILQKKKMRRSGKAFQARYFVCLYTCIYICVCVLNFQLRGDGETVMRVHRFQKKKNIVFQNIPDPYATGFSMRASFVYE